MSRSDRKFASPTKMKEETQPPAEIRERNLWSETHRHSSSHRGHSPKWTDWDASDVKSKDRSGWPSWQFSQGENDMQKDDTISRDVRKISNSPTFDEQGYEEYGHSPDNCQTLSYRGRGRDRKRSRSRSKSRSRDRGRIRSPRRDENRGRGRGRNRSWERGRSRSRSRSPFRDLRHASYELTEKRSGSRMTSKACRDFSVGKCRRGSQCGFSHHGNLNYRDGGSSENDLTERRRSRADDGGALTYGNNKWAADNPRDSISDGYRKYYEEDESLRDSRKDTLCCIDFLKGKCRRGASCRYPHHHNSAGDNYDTENKKVFYDRDVKREANKSGKYPCKYFSMGKCHRNDCRFSHDGPAAGTLDGRLRNDKGGHNLDDKNESWNGPKWGDDAGFPDTAKVTVREEDMKKSWNGPTWDDVAGFADEPKATGWGDSTQTNYHGPMSADNRTDDKWCHSVEDESKVKGGPGGNEKVADRGEFLSHITETANAKGWGEDKKISWNDPQCDALKSPSDRLQPTGWGDSSFKNKNSHDPMVADEQNDDKWGPSLENERKARGGPGWNEMATDGLKVLTSNRQNGRNGRSRDDRRGYDLDYKNKSRSGSRDAVAVFPYTAKATGHGEDKKKPWNGPTWDDVADSLDRPETTGWGGTSIGNTEVMIPGGNGKDSHDSTASEKPSNDRWGCSLGDERKARGGRGWKSRNEKAADGVEFLTSNQQNGSNRMSHDDRRDYNLDDKNKSQTGSRDATAGFPYNVKVKGQEEDKKKSWNGPTWDDVEDSLDRPKATGWGGSSTRNTDSHDPAAAEKQSDYNMGHSLAKKKKAMSGPGQTEKVSGRDDFLSSHWQKGSNGADKGITELIDSKMLIYGKQHQNNAQGSELQTLGGISTHVHEQNMIPDTSARQLDDTSMQPEIPEISYIQPHQLQGVDNSMAIAARSDAVNQLQLSENDTHRTKVLGDSLGSPPPSSLSGTDQSCHKLSLKPSNFLNIDLNKSVQHKVSTLNSQNQAQIHCKEVVNTPEMTEFGDPQKSHIGQQNPPNTTGLVHPNSSKVSESGGLEVEYQESSMLKLDLEEAVAKPEVNVSNDIVTEDNRNNDKGEKRKQEQENIHLGGVDAHYKVEESQDEKAMRLFKISLVELVKEILNPTWKQGKMSKEVYKTIVKKAVDKVTSTIHGVQIPKTQEHIDHYISFSKLKISNLVEAYVEKFQNN